MVFTLGHISGVGWGYFLTRLGKRAGMRQQVLTLLVRTLMERAVQSYVKGWLLVEGGEHKEENFYV